MAENKKFQSDIVIEKNVNHKLEEKILKKKKEKNSSKRKGNNKVAEITWKYHAYQIAFVMRILKTQ